VAVQDRERRIVLRSSEPQAYIGEPSPSGLLALIPDQDNGRLVVPDVLGVRRLWAFTEVAGTGWRVAAGIREDEAFARSDRALLNGTLAGLALLVLSWLMAWRLSMRIVRPIEALSAVASRVASGDDSARVDLGRGPKDIETVMQVFNRMLDVRAQAQAALGEREQRLQFLLSRTSAAIFTSRASGDFAMTFVSDSVQNLLGYSPAEFLSVPDFWSAHLHPEDRERFRALRGSFLQEGLLNFEYRFLH
jgi:PAS domain-containing protein